MKFRKIISIIFSILTVFIVFLGINNQAFSILTSEEYYSCFEKQDSSEIIINKLEKEDEEAVKSMIDEDGDFLKWLGNGTDNFNSDEYKLDVGYWIGKQFRGNGYAHLAVSKIISKIWEIDKSVSFVFDIDDENVASIKTLEKICSDLKIDLNSSRFMKKHLMSVEIIVKQNEDGTYLFQSYLNGILNVRKSVSKEKILELYSEEKLENGIHIKQSSSRYLLKGPESTV